MANFIVISMWQKNSLHATHGSTSEGKASMVDDPFISLKMGTPIIAMRDKAFLNSSRTIFEAHLQNQISKKIVLLVIVWLV